MGEEGGKSVRSEVGKGISLLREWNPFIYTNRGGSSYREGESGRAEKSVCIARPVHPSLLEGGGENSLWTGLVLFLL